jgi:hypothetical protein
MMPWQSPLWFGVRNISATQKIHKKNKVLNDPVSGVALSSVSIIWDGYLVRNRFV